MTPSDSQPVDAPIAFDLPAEPPMEPLADAGASPKRPREDKECAICLEAILDGQGKFVGPCGHAFGPFGHMYRYWECQNHHHPLAPRN